MRKSAGERFLERINKTESCWIWTSQKNKQGYGLFFNKKIMSAHRFSYEFFIGKIPNGLCVLHNCPGGDNSSCVRPSHLWLGTHKDNTKDMFNKGRSNKASGSSHGAAQLTEQDVMKIRQLWKNATITQKEMAKIYKVSTGHICGILKRNYWKNI